MDPEQRDDFSQAMMTLQTDCMLERILQPSAWMLNLNIPLGHLHLGL